MHAKAQGMSVWILSDAQRHGCRFHGPIVVEAMPEQLGDMGFTLRVRSAARSAGFFVQPMDGYALPHNGRSKNCTVTFW